MLLFEKIRAWSEEDLLGLIFIKKISKGKFPFF